MANDAVEQPQRHIAKENSATVKANGKVRIWYGVNYGPHCGSVGAPMFVQTSNPHLGQVTTTQDSNYVTPASDFCAGQTYTTLSVWYKAGSRSGTDVFTYTIEWGHELRNPIPSTGPHETTETITIK